MMYVEFGYVEGPEVVTQADYFTCLHELGHHAHGHTQGRPPKHDEKFYFTNGVLRSEAQAWEWALDHADETPDHATRHYMWDYCLGSYYRAALVETGNQNRLWNGDRHHVAFAYDAPDDYFVRIARRLVEGIETTFAFPIPKVA